MRYIIIIILIVTLFLLFGKVTDAATGFPGAFQGGFSTGNMNIGAVQVGPPVVGAGAEIQDDFIIIIIN